MCGTFKEILFDNGATTNLVRRELFREFQHDQEMRPNDGHLVTADGRGMDSDGSITINLKFREIDDDIEALLERRKRLRFRCGISRYMTPEQVTPIAKHRGADRTRWVGRAEHHHGSRTV